MQPYVIYYFWIWKNLHRDKEIDRIRRSKELLKLGVDQKIFMFSGSLP